jgi:hypothetical protein
LTRNQKQEEQKDLFILASTTVMTIMMKVSVLLQKVGATT